MRLWIMLIISLPVRAVASTDDDTGFCQVLSPKMLGSLWNHFGIVMTMGKVCQQWDNSRITWGNVEVLGKLYGFFHPFPYLARFFVPSPPAPSRSRQPHQGLPGNRGRRRGPMYIHLEVKMGAQNHPKFVKFGSNSWNLSIETHGDLGIIVRNPQIWPRSTVGWLMGFPILETRRCGHPHFCSLSHVQLLIVHLYTANRISRTRFI